MFEKWNEMLEHQPDWLEVPLPSGFEQQFEKRLLCLGVTKEQAIHAFVQRVLATIKEDETRPPVSAIADFAIRDMITQSLIEPTGAFYRIEVPDFACPAFITWTHDLFGTLEDITAFIEAHDEKQRLALEALQLTAVPIMGTRTAINENVEISHLNVYGWPYIMHSPCVESVHVWVKQGDKYIRCVRARMKDLAYSTPEIHDGLHPLKGHTWGYPHIIEYVKPYTFNRLYEVEERFDSWAEAEKDMKSFTGTPNLTEVFNEIIGDG